MKAKNTDQEWSVHHLVCIFVCLIVNVICIYGISWLARTVETVLRHGKIGMACIPSLTAATLRYQRWPVVALLLASIAGVVIKMSRMSPTYVHALCCLFLAAHVLLTLVTAVSFVLLFVPMDYR